MSTGTIGHLNEVEPALQYEPGVVDPELVRQALQQVQHREGFGKGKVVPVWSALIAAARYAIEDLQQKVRAESPKAASNLHNWQLEGSAGVWESYYKCSQCGKMAREDSDGPSLSVDGCEAASPKVPDAAQNIPELEMHRADYNAIKAAGFESPGELLDAYNKLSGMEIVPVVGKDSFVQLVPDHCDRIVWRGSYHHLPLAATKEKGE